MIYPDSFILKVSCLALSRSRRREGGETLNPGDNRDNNKVAGEDSNNLSEAGEDSNNREDGVDNSSKEEVAGVDNSKEDGKIKVVTVVGEVNNKEEDGVKVANKEDGVKVASKEAGVDNSKEEVAGVANKVETKVGEETKVVVLVIKEVDGWVVKVVTGAITCKVTTGSIINTNNKTLILEITLILLTTLTNRSFKSNRVLLKK